MIDPGQPVRPWSDAERVAVVRRMYAVDHLATVTDLARRWGISTAHVRHIAEVIGTGRFLFGVIRFTEEEVERMRDRPDRRRRPVRSWAEVR